MLRKKFFLTIIGAISSIGFFSSTSCHKEESSDEKVTLLSTDGELYHKSIIGRNEMPDFEKKIPVKKVK